MEAMMMILNALELRRPKSRTVRKLRARLAPAITCSPSCVLAVGPARPAAPALGASAGEALAVQDK
eukprot:1788016-Pyramimonas_sp.AAC.1